MHAHDAYKPLPMLRNHIERIWVRQPSGRLDHARPFRILPDGSAHLIFCVYGDTGAVLHTPYGAPDCSLRFVGARSRYKDTNLRRRARTLIVGFRPGGAAPFFACPASAYTDYGIPLDELWGQEGRDLLDALVAAHDVTAQVEVLMATFARKLTHAAPVDPAVAHIVRQLEATHGQTPIAALTQPIGYSERHLRTRFQQTVGLSPKRLARILRVKRTLRLAEQDDTPHWSALALANGFHDQAHLIRDFHALLGASPTTYLAQH